MTLDPPVLWVGGKRKMALDLSQRVMTHLTNRYIEPFLGGGAVALAMPADVPMILGDACKPLGYLWWWIGREPEAIADYAAGYGLKLGEGWNTEPGYIAARLEHNQQPWSDDDWRPSARFLWLNRAGFNGLYRENSSGLLNVPWGRRKTIAIPSPAELQAIATHVAGASIYPGWDFADTLAMAGPGDVAFVDPPYDSDADNFTSYTAVRFTALEQVRLRDMLEVAIDRGATVITTNADTPHVRELYRGVWTIEDTMEDRPVAADPDARAPAKCLIITGRR